VQGEDDEEEEAGPAAAWWEEWEEQHPASRKRRHPTSKPTAEDEEQDQGLASMTTQVCTSSCAHHPTNLSTDDCSQSTTRPRSAAAISNFGQHK